MEDYLQEISSQTFEKKHIQSVFSVLEEAIDAAKEERDLELADNPDLRKALNLVEEFLRKSGRICYGGMAINAHLPTSNKFYDFSKTLPDYDFFTPDSKKDLHELVRLLKAAGFEDVSVKEGMHEGTKKVFVNYNGVADLTTVEPWLYSMLKKKAIQEDGITYADADFLRMNMYLELSRPRGEVERWEKVYKRLVLLNLAKKPHTVACKRGAATNRMRKDVHSAILDYLMKNHLIFAGAELKRIYEHPNTTSAGYLLSSTNPIVAFTDRPEYHLPILRQLIHDRDGGLKLQMTHWPAQHDLVPEMYGITANGRLILLLVSEVYCNAYNTVTIPKGRQMRIAALDTAITLFYQLGFVRGMDGLVPKSVQCFADALVEVSMKTRDKNVPSKFPLFVTTCHGHQPSKASLLREKVKRIRLMKTKKKRTPSLIRSIRTQKHRN